MSRMVVEVVRGRHGGAQAPRSRAFAAARPRAASRPPPAVLTSTAPRGIVPDQTIDSEVAMTPRVMSAAATRTCSPFRRTSSPRAWTRPSPRVLEARRPAALGLGRRGADVGLSLPAPRRHLAVLTQGDRGAVRRRRRGHRPEDALGEPAAGAPHRVTASTSDSAWPARGGRDPRDAQPVLPVTPRRPTRRTESCPQPSSPTSCSRPTA